MGKLSWGPWVLKQVLTPCFIGTAWTMHSIYGSHGIAQFRNGTCNREALHTLVESNVARHPKRLEQP
jgi:hypothetical protein